MKRFLTVLLLLTLSLSALAEVSLTFTDDLTGVYTYPEGASTDEARYVYSYCYPQLAGDSELAVLFNSTYQYAATDALGFEVPMLASGMSDNDPAKHVDISYEITCMNNTHLSVKVIKRVASGGTETLVISGHVFALTGKSAGSIISLPYLLGLLDIDDTDEWYQDRQTAKADKCVRQMVWDRLARMEAQGEIDLYDDLTYDEFEAGFYPEEDFYLDQNGDPAFYLLPGSVAPEENGVVTVVITMEDLLDEL